MSSTKTTAAMRREMAKMVAESRSRMSEEQKREHARLESDLRKVSDAHYSYLDVVVKQRDEARERIRSLRERFVILVDRLGGDGGSVVNWSADSALRWDSKDPTDQRLENAVWSTAFEVGEHERLSLYWQMWAALGYEPEENEHDGVVSPERAISDMRAELAGLRKAAEEMVRCLSAEGLSKQTVGKKRAMAAYDKLRSALGRK